MWWTKKPKIDPRIKIVATSDEIEKLLASIEKGQKARLMAALEAALDRKGYPMVIAVLEGAKEWE